MRDLVLKKGETRVRNLGNLCIQGSQELVHVKDGRRAYGTGEPTMIALSKEEQAHKKEIAPVKQHGRLLVVLQHLVEALQMHRVPTPEHRRLPQRIKHVLPCNNSSILT